MKGPTTQILDELSRRIAGMLRVGLVHEIDYPGLRLRVRSGDITTGWLPWPGYLGRNRVDWTPLVVGQEVLIAAPSGDLSQAVVVALLHVTSDPPPSTDETQDVVRFRSGSTVTHDADTGDLEVTGVRNIGITAAEQIVLTVGRSTITMTDSDLLLVSPHIGEND